MELVESRAKIKTGIPTSGLFVLVGNPKSGKTSFAASFPDSYVLELEKGGGDRVDGRIHQIADLGEFREALKLAVEEPKIKTVVIDTVDVLSDWLEDDVAHAAGLESINETKKGVDGFELWANFRKRIEGLVGHLQTCNKLAILIAHCREAKLDASGVLAAPAGINVPGKAGSYLASQADMIGYAYKKVIGAGTGYFVTFQGGPLGIWGSRVDEINDKTLQLPRENPYSAFAAAFQPSNGHKAAVEAKPALAGAKR